MVIQLEAMLRLYHSSHTMEAMVLAKIQKKVRSKCRNKDEAAVGKLDLSDASDASQ